MTLAIDPGNEQSALVLYDGRILESAILPNDVLLRTLRTWSAQECPDLVIEKIASYGMAVGETTFETVFWSGRFVEAWGDRSPVSRIKRHEVKMHVCKDSRAKDSNIRQALIDRFGEPGTKKNPGATYGLSKDMWAALAVAVTHEDKKAA